MYQTIAQRAFTIPHWLDFLGTKTIRECGVQIKEMDRTLRVFDEDYGEFYVIVGTARGNLRVNVMRKTYYHLLLDNPVFFVEYRQGRFSGKLEGQIVW